VPDNESDCEETAAMPMPPGSEPPPPQPKPHGLELLEPSSDAHSLGRLGHYEIRKVLGRGGFGTVVKAFDTKLHRDVAIKILDPRHGPDSDAAIRFLREARAAAVIRHENVVQIHSVEESPAPYLVMEYIPGESLADRIAREHPLEAGEVAGIGAAHARGLIHRDLKPANILVEFRHGALHAKLADFGLALTANDARLTQSGLIVGTPAFMAPEQTRGDPLDHRADLFSLGSVLYACLAGKSPFEAEGVLPVMRRIDDCQFRSLAEVAPDTPPWLARIIEQLLRRDPAERFATAADVAVALTASQETVVASRGPKALPKPVAPQPVQARRVPAVAVAAALLLILAVGVGTLVPWRAAGTNRANMNATPAAVTLVDPFAGLSLADVLTSDQFEWTTPKNVGPAVSSPGLPERYPTLSADELTIIFERNLRLFQAERTNRDEPFTRAATEVFPNLHDVLSAEFTSPTISGDGCTLFFKAQRWQLRPAASGAKPGPPVLHRLMRSSRPATDRAFAFPEVFEVRDPAGMLSANDANPILTPDRDWLFCATNWPSTTRQTDIVRLARRADGSFAGAAILPGPHHTPEFDGPLWVSPDGGVLIAYSQVRNQGVDNPHRIFERDSASGTFRDRGVFNPLPKPWHTVRYWLRGDGRRIYFQGEANERPGTGTPPHDIFYSDLRPKTSP
jgi:hypothetical protein